MKQEIVRMLSCLSLVSRLPVPLRQAPDYRHSDFWLPSIGLPVGCLGFAVTWLASLLFGPGLLAVLAGMAAQYAAFNLFHLDGLMDTADAAGVMAGPEKRRAILKDSRIGVFAFFAGFLALGTRWAAGGQLLAAQPALLWAALLLAPVAGRLAGILTIAGGRPANPEGLAAAMGEQGAIPAAFGYCLGASPAFFYLAIQDHLLSAILLFVGAAGLAGLVGLAVRAWYQRRVGGYTGDAIGAAIELTEVLCMLLFVLRLRLGA